MYDFTRSNVANIMLLESQTEKRVRSESPSAHGTALG